MIKEIFFVSCLVGIAFAFPSAEEDESQSKIVYNVEDSVQNSDGIESAGETLETAEQRGGWGRGGGGWGRGGGGWGRGGGGGGWGRGGGWGGHHGGYRGGWGRK